MNHCLNCSLHDNLTYCCRSHPETKESELRIINGVEYSVCPQLGNDGLCTNYDDRSPDCRSYECPTMREQPFLEDLFDDQPLNRFF